MGFFSKLFGKNQDTTKSNNNSFSAESVKPNLDFYENLVDKIAVSETLQNQLKVKIKQAFNDPKSFYDEDNEFILSDRGLTFPKDTLLTPKFVLIDTLQENDQMAEVDWKEEEEEVRFALNRIGKAKNYNFKLPDDAIYEENDTFEVIKLINNKELKPLGFSLEILDINSDSYVFTVVLLSNQQEITMLFNQLK